MEEAHGRGNGSQNGLAGEAASILTTVEDAHREGVPVALVTVVRVHGSSYRRPGAKMLIGRDGRTAGIVSGGCLERDLIRRTALAIDQERSSLVRYDTRADADAEDHYDERDLIQNAGLGCEGVIELYIDCHPKPHLDSLARALHERREIVHALSLPDGSTYCDRIVPPPELVLFGAGQDAVPLCRLARELGWQTAVIDLRSSFQVPRRLFSGVERYVISSPSNAVADSGVHSESLVLVMTHHFEHDQELLEALLPIAPRYLGLLGPRIRGDKILTELRARGLEFPEGALHFPIGLDIGGDSPSAVALSALAEIQAVLAGREGGFLSKRPGPIHELISQTDPALLSATIKENCEWNSVLTVN